jgi:hypothetical protein
VAMMNSTPTIMAVFLLLSIVDTPLALVFELY